MAQIGGSDGGGYGDKKKYDTYLDYLNRYRKQKTLPPPKQQLPYRPATGNIGNTTGPASGQLGAGGISQEEYNKWMSKGYAPSAWKNGNAWQREAARRIESFNRNRETEQKRAIVKSGKGSYSLNGPNVSTIVEGQLGTIPTQQRNYGWQGVPSISGTVMYKDLLDPYKDMTQPNAFHQALTRQTMGGYELNPYVKPYNYLNDPVLGNMGTIADDPLVTSAMRNAGLLPQLNPQTYGPDVLPDNTGGGDNGGGGYDQYPPWADLNLRGGGGYGGGYYGGGYGGGGNYNVNYNNNYRGGTGSRINDINKWYANMVQWNVNKPRGA